jgi:hypothetical protein
VKETHTLRGQGKKEAPNTRNVLEHIPAKFDIMSEGIDIQTQKEYLEYSSSFACGTLTDQATLKLSSILFSSKTMLADKKKIFITIVLVIFVSQH